MAVSFAQFGCGDKHLYAAYLGTYYGSGIEVSSARGALFTDFASFSGGGGAGWCSNCAGGGCDGYGQHGRQSAAGERQGRGDEGGETRGLDTSGAFESRDGGEWRAGVAGSRGDVASGDVGSHGKHWKKNRAKREKVKAMKRSWRGVDASGGCVSDESVASARTVDTRTAVEIEAAQTLAARRVVENQLAIAKGRAQLRGFADRAKTDAVNRLAEARMEQRINEARAKSQASFKKCDEKISLDSAGSAGEFAVRREVRKARRSEAMLKYVQEQADILAACASPEALEQVRRLPPPKPVDAFELFGECSPDASPEEAEAYYEELRLMNEEEDARFYDYTRY